MNNDNNIYNLSIIYNNITRIPLDSLTISNGLVKCTLYNIVYNSCLNRRYDTRKVIVVKIPK